MKNAIIVPTYKVGYYRNCRTGLINVVNGRSKTAKRATVHPTIFLAVFPKIDRRWTGGEADATYEQLVALGLAERKRPSIKISGMPLQARYVYEPSNGRYIVRLLGTRQELSSNPIHFRKVTGVSRRAVLGSVSLDYEQAAALGFIVTEGVSANDGIQSAVLCALA